jgi:hypothetical protein
VSLMIKCETFREKLLSQRYRASEIPAHDEPGVYALFLVDRTALPGLAVESDVLYVGKGCRDEASSARELRST